MVKIGNKFSFTRSTCHHFKNKFYILLYQNTFNTFHSSFKAWAYSHSCGMSLGFWGSVSEMCKSFSATSDNLPWLICFPVKGFLILLLDLHFCLFDFLPLGCSQVRQVDIYINNHTHEDGKRGILIHTLL